MPRSTLYNRPFIVVTSFLNGSSWDRRARFSRACRLLDAWAWLLCCFAPGADLAQRHFHPSRSGAIEHVCHNHRMALSWCLLQAGGLRRLPRISYQLPERLAVRST